MQVSTLLPLAFAPILFILFWHLSRTSPTPSSIPSFTPPTTLRSKRIVLLIAHPDDEAMFFSPTLLYLTHPSLGNHLKILCLSTGNAEHLGETRRQELLKSAQHLGLRKPEDVFVIDDDKRFPDTMLQEWDQEEVAELLAAAFTPRHRQVGKTANGSVSARKARDKEQQEAVPEATIDVLITFDAGGVSGHANHRSLYYGAQTFLANLMKGRVGWRCPVEFYSLTSVNVVRKYAFVLDAPVTMVGGLLGNLLSGRRKGTGNGMERVLFVSGLAEYWKARAAMVTGHKSQMVWFRWGWIGIGRYMVVNDLKRERVIGG